MIVRGAFNHFLRPGLRRDFRDEYNSYPEEYSQVVRVGSMDRPEVELVTISGLTRQVELGEGEAYSFIDPKMSDKITKTDTEYGLGFVISKNMMEDDQYGIIGKKNAKWLARSVRLTQEFETADLLDDAFTGSTFTGLFGESLCEGTHQLLGNAETWSNQISGDPQLSVTGLQAAFELAENTVDQNGYPIPIQIQKLIVNVRDEWVAIQLTQNESEPYTSDRNINATLRKRRLAYLVNHYKDQTGRDWFAQDPKLNDAHHLFKVRPQFPDWYEEKTRAAYFAARQRFLVYFYDQRGWIGSNAT